MATKHNEMQSVIRLYKEQTGKTEVDMHEIAKFAVGRLGWQMPPPVNPLDRLAKEFSRAARQEFRKDPTTGKPYRANHAIKETQPNGEQLTWWIDIDEAQRPRMFKSLQQRREQMVGDGYYLSLDADHWNRKNSHEQPIQIELDFTDDIEWRKNAPDTDEDAA